MRTGQSDSLTLLDLMFFVASLTAVGTAVIVEMGWVRCRISCLLQETETLLEPGGCRDEFGRI